MPCLLGAAREIVGDDGIGESDSDAVEARLQLASAVVGNDFMLQ